MIIPILSKYNKIRIILTGLLKACQLQNKGYKTDMVQGIRRINSFLLWYSANLWLIKNSEKVGECYGEICSSYHKSYYGALNQGWKTCDLLKYPM